MQSIAEHERVKIDPRLIPNVDDSAVRPDGNNVFDKPRLDQDDVARYFREGYLLYNHPTMREKNFVGLKSLFEELLIAHTKAGRAPEAMDVPHFADHRLLKYVFSDEILDLVEPLIGPDIALYSTHFIAKLPGSGKRVPWHEDSFYWKGTLDPMHVCTVWLAIDPSIPENSCMNVLPRSFDGNSEYVSIDGTTNVFDSEIKWLKNVTVDQVADAPDRPKNVSRQAVRCVLRPNESSLHDARLIHGSDANTSNMRRCGYTMRFIPAKVRYNSQARKGEHQIYLARGIGHPANDYADPARSYPEIFAKRFGVGNSH
jgi:hypothetical protein